MKKILTVLLCVVLLFGATSMIAFASESGESAVAETDKPITDIIVEYLQENSEEFAVIGTLLGTIFYEVRKHRKLNGSIGTLNNNAITIAERSSETIKTALAEVEGIADVINGYKDEFASLLGEIRKSAEEKQSLETTLNHVETFLKTAKLATLELSNEVAELLVLANIPNSKKEELYSRHTQAVHALEAVEGVTSDDDSEA